MGTLERRGREKERRRQDILDAARGLFWTRGFAGTTMPEVARAVELAPGTLYLYFPSKDALYVELLVEGYDLLLAHLLKSGRKGASARQRAETLIDSFLHFARNHAQYFDIIFFVVQRETGSGLGVVLKPEQLARLGAKEAACKAIAAEVLNGKGGRRSVRDAQLLVDTIWSMLVGIVSIWGKDKSFPAVAATARRLLLDALYKGA